MKLTVTGESVAKTWIRRIQSAVILALGILLAAATSPSIHYDSPWSLFFAVLVLTLLNVFLRPLLVLFTLPFVILSLGVGLLLLNAVLFLIADALVSGFRVDTFWAALWAAFLVAVTQFLINLILHGSIVARRGKGVTVQYRYQAGPRSGRRIGDRARKRDDDIIDV